MEKIDDIINEIFKNLRERFGESAVLKLDELLLDNGQVSRCVFIKRSKSHVGVRMDIDLIKKLLDDGQNLEEICESLYNAAIVNTDINGMTSKDFRSWKYMREWIYPRLLNTEKNTELLASMPHKEVFDLSIAYYIAVSSRHGRLDNISNVTYDLCELWGVDLDELNDIAFKNLLDKRPPRFNDIASEIIQTFIADGIPIGKDGVNIPERRMDMYVLTSGDSMLGSIYLCVPSVLKSVSNIIGDNFLIASVSENQLILFKASESVSADKLEWLKGIVAGINERAEDPSIYLTDSIYRYHNGNVERIM